MVEIEKLLEEIEKLDLLESGKFFAYIYETGDELLKEKAMRALMKFYNKNMLDFTVYRSAIFFEKEVIKFCKELMHGTNVYGTFTYGGTESIMLAVLAARNYFFKTKGKNVVPEILVPFTIHPSFFKAAHYLGLGVKIFDINEKMKADIESMKSLINDKTALIACSAPNWPYGTIDPVKEIAEIAYDNNIPLHVDACVGGFILPFFEKMGLINEIFDFRIEGISSISLDVHKYGYSPKGASVVLFKNEELKKASMFVDVSNPGYIFVNNAILSSRSVGPLAAAYATIKYLGEEGYMNLARKVWKARDIIYNGMLKLGFKNLGPIESPILALYNNDVDLASFMLKMRELGWHFHLQRAVKKYNIPLNIHLTISPIHERTAEDFLKDVEKALNSSIKIEFELDKIGEYLKTGKIDSSLAPLFIEAFDEKEAIEIVKNLVIGLYLDE